MPLCAKTPAMIRPTAKMIPISEAFEIIDHETQPLETISVELSRSVGCILGQDIIADSDLPPFDRSQMDGFAVRSKDVETAPVDLVIVGESAAGRGWEGELKQGEAVRIMTGAPLPKGADAVQKLELAAETPALFHRGLKQDEPSKSVRILEPAENGKFIVHKGAEIKDGTRIFERGEMITAGMIASIAAFGYPKLTVGRQPRVTILSTGSEIVRVDERPGKDQIRNSNSPMIAALVDQFGGTASELPLVSDDALALADAITIAAGRADILVITGGVSVGKYDLTKDVLRSLGAELFFERVRLKPGKPTVFGRLNDTLVFGLPGNPVSAAVTFHLFVHRAMLRMQGAGDVSLRSGFAVAAKKVKGDRERDAFLPAALQTDSRGQTLATPLKWLGSSDFIGFARTEALIFVPAAKVFEAGDVVQTYLIS